MLGSGKKTIAKVETPPPKEVDRISSFANPLVQFHE